MSLHNYSFFSKGDSHLDSPESKNYSIKQESTASKGKNVLKKLEKKMTYNIITAISNETAVLENTLFFPKLPNIEMIGKGGFSQVFKLNFLTLQMAKKEFNFFSLESFLKEYGFIRILRHPNVPLLYGCYLENNLDDILSFIRDSEIANKISSFKTSLSFQPEPIPTSPQQTPSGNFFLDDKIQFFELSSKEGYLNSEISQNMSETSINQLNKFKDNNLRLKLISKNDVNYDEMSFTNNLTLPSIPEPTSCKNINKIIKHLLEINTKSKYVSTTLSSFSKSQFRDVSELKFSLLTEFVDGKSLEEILSLLTSDLVKLLIMIDLSKVLKFLHDNGVIHRDLKPNNVMISLKDMTPKILDFGISKLSDRSKTTTLLKGTLSYMAPENFGLEMYDPEISQNENGNGNKISKINNKIDVWAFGCILNEVFSKYNMKPWEGEDNDNQILSNLVMGKAFPIDESIDNIYIKNLISDCTLNEPESRPDFYLIYCTLLVALKEHMIIYNGVHSKIMDELSKQIVDLSNLAKVDFRCSKSP